MKEECSDVASQRDGLTQVILQHGAILALLAALSVLIENPAGPLVVDRDCRGGAGAELARLRTGVRDCRIATFKTQHQRKESAPEIKLGEGMIEICHTSDPSPRSPN